MAIAVSSSSPAVAARCAHARSGVGVVASQNITDPRLGPQGLDLMARGASANEAATILKVTAPHGAYRQVSVLGADGRTAAFSGTRALGLHATDVRQDAVAAGNMLAHTGVPSVMCDAFFDRENEELGPRVIAALQAGLRAGGEAGPVRSAGLLMVGEVPWAIADLRVDWHDDPVNELAALWAVWEPQMEAYLTRALDPSAAPSFGVPGDE
jgi:uncharacterized Ntn-hydrolase superfamily protein